jgi:hypothetical protein
LHLREVLTVDFNAIRASIADELTSACPSLFLRVS